MPDLLAPPRLAGIALGSNIPSAFGGPADNLREALHRLAALGDVMAVSSFHATDPVGYLEQPRFLNAAALLRTRLSPHDLLRELLAIESAMGRDRSLVPRKGPRIIDLDLLLVDAEVVQTTDLILPHPALHQRVFVLAPLAEIAPHWRHPQLHRSVTQLLAVAGTSEA